MACDFVTETNVQCRRSSAPSVRPARAGPSGRVWVGGAVQLASANAALLNAADYFGAARVCRLTIDDFQAILEEVCARVRVQAVSAG